ncbi:MAG: methyltransferase domain-containing protein [Thermoanaerobaculales bacterium]
MSGDDHAAVDDPSPEEGQPEGPLRRLGRALSAWLPWRLDRRLRGLVDQVAEVDRGRDLNARRLDDLEGEFRRLQDAIDVLRGGLLNVDRRVDDSESALRGVGAEVERLRDRLVPAAVRRSDALLDRLAAELEEVASLVERSLRGEPLPVPGNGVIDEGRLAKGLAEVQPQLLEAFRGSEEEIHHRLDRYLPDLQKAGPVLDLGCGRGELLLLLREAGVEATGIEGDAAVATAARRRGLSVVEGDVLEALRAQPAASWGAVTAIHFLEHLVPEALLAVLAEVRRVLRPGGLLLAECPNPHSLRVGAALFWQDPTHQRPLLPETLELFVRASGLAVLRRELLHPFPEDQLLATDDIPLDDGASPQLIALNEQLDGLRRRLDEILNGPRDFAVWASRPEEN